MSIVNLTNDDLIGYLGWLYRMQKSLGENEVCHIFRLQTSGAPP